MLNFRIDEFSVWEKLQKTEDPIIMYGTGNGADKVVDIFEKLDIKLSGITASSGFVRERFFRGFSVKPLEFFEKQYNNFTIVKSSHNPLSHQKLDNLLTRFFDCADYFAVGNIF